MFQCGKHLKALQSPCFDVNQVTFLESVTPRVARTLFVCLVLLLAWFLVNRKSLLEFSIGLILIFCLPFGRLHCWFKNLVLVWFLDSDLVLSVFGIVDVSCWAGLVSETRPSVSGCQ